MTGAAMNPTLILRAAVLGAALAVAAPAFAQTAAQKQQDLKGAEATGQRNDTQPMTAAQQAQYKQEYQAAKAKWASLSPADKAKVVAAAKTRKLSDLSALELVGQSDDMQRETAGQSAQLKAEADAAKAKWAAMSPAERQALRKSAWDKKRESLTGMEAVGQRDDDYVLPF